MATVTPHSEVVGCTVTLTTREAVALRRLLNAANYNEVTSIRVAQSGWIYNFITDLPVEA